MFSDTVKFSTRKLPNGHTIFTIQFKDGRTIDFATAKLLAVYLNQHDLEIELDNGRAA